MTYTWLDVLLLPLLNSELSYWSVTNTRTRLSNVTAHLEIPILSSIH